MATVSNLKLEIQHGGSGSRRRVTVSYKIYFSHTEVLAGAVFLEHVNLWGDDPVFDDNISRLLSSSVKAEQSSVTRRFTRSVSRSRLDEDGDTVVLGIPINANRDELYAKVLLTPYMPKKTSAKSNIVTGQFGAAGND